MTAEQILKELEELADRSGITIRYEKGDFDGGFCVLKAERLIVVNRKLAPTKKGSVVAQAIAEVGVEEVYLKPAVREFIEEELSKAALEAMRSSGISTATAPPASTVEPTVVEASVTLDETPKPSTDAGPITPSDGGKAPDSQLDPS